MNESLITVREAIKLLPKKDGKKIHIRTVMRWILNGTRGAFLKAQRIGGCWYTSAEWLDQFKLDCNRTVLSKQASTGAGTASHEAALKILKERYGFGEPRTNSKPQKRGRDRS